MNSWDVGIAQERAAAAFRKMLAELDEAVAEGWLHAIVLAEHIREAKAAAWDEGYEAYELDLNHRGKRMRTTSNPYEAEAGGS